MSQQPIGFFDSGVGGTSIWKECISYNPKESSIYLADSLFAPYGEKSKERIIDLSCKNVDFLLRLGCKLIVVACNTATTNAIDVLRERYDVPFVGIEPAIKPAALDTKTNSIGILATKGTITSSLFHKTSKNWASGINVVKQVGEGLVECIENGEVQSDKVRRLLLKYIQPMLDQDVDYIVLGCTHYPYLIPMLKTMVPPNVSIIDSGYAVAKQTASLLKQHKIQNIKNQKVKHQLFTNKNKNKLEFFVKDVQLDYTVQKLLF